MESFITFLNNNNGFFSLIFSFFVMLSTIIYAILTSVLVNETRKMRKIQTEPKIQILLETFETSVNTIKLNIKNIGQGPALNVTFKTNVISGGDDGKKIVERFSAVKAFSSGLNYFGPSQSFNTNYFNVIGIQNENLFNIVLNIEIKYRSVTRKKYNENVTIDFRELEGTYQLGKPNLFSIAQSLEKIEKTLHNITSGFMKMKVDVFNSEDREKQEKEYLERINQLENEN
jgi:hypothetical protein